MGHVSLNSCKGGDVDTVSHTGWEGGGFFLSAQAQPLICFPNWPLMRGQQSERGKKQATVTKINISCYRQERSIYFPGFGAQPCCQSAPTRL